MKLTANSHKLLDFFIKNRCILPSKQTNQTNNIFEHMYYEINDAVTYIDKLEKNNKDFYTMTIEDITNINEIPKPSTFPPNSFPSIVRNEIDQEVQCKITFTTKLFDRNIKVYFLLEDRCNTGGLYVKYFKYIWRYSYNIYISYFAE